MRYLSVLSSFKFFLALNIHLNMAYICYRALGFEASDEVMSEFYCIYYVMMGLFHVQTFMLLTCSKEQWIFLIQFPFTNENWAFISQNFNHFSFAIVFPILFFWSCRKNKIHSHSPSGFQGTYLSQYYPFFPLFTISSLNFFHFVENSARQIILYTGYMACHYRFNSFIINFFHYRFNAFVVYLIILR